MKGLQRMGGIAALYQAAAYVVAMVFFLLVLNFTAIADPTQRVALIVDNQAGMAIVTLIAYVVFGVSLVVLSLALYHRLKGRAPAVAQTATVFGFIWAVLLIGSGMVHNAGLGIAAELYAQDPEQAALFWTMIEVVANGLGGEVEIVGGLWMLLVSWAALRSGRLPRALNYLGLVIGAAGLLTLIPPLYSGSVAVFGLGQIVWFVWLGIALLRTPARVAAEQVEAPSPAAAKRC